MQKIICPKCGGEINYNLAAEVKDQRDKLAVELVTHCSKCGEEYFTFVPIGNFINVDCDILKVEGNHD